MVKWTFPRDLKKKEKFPKTYFFQSNRASIFHGWSFLKWTILFSNVSPERSRRDRRTVLGWESGGGGLLVCRVRKGLYIIELRENPP